MGSVWLSVRFCSEMRTPHGEKRDWFALMDRSKSQAVDLLVEFEWAVQILDARRSDVSGRLAE